MGQGFLPTGISEKGGKRNAAHLTRLNSLKLKPGKVFFHTEDVVKELA